MKAVIFSAALLISFISLASSSLLVDRLYESGTFAEGIQMKIVYNVYNNYPV